MPPAIARSGLRSDDATVDGWLRPPGSVDPETFADLCDQCGQCVEVCPSKIIEMDAEGYPMVDAASGQCHRCSLCADVCTRGAIEPPGRGAASTSVSEADARALARAAIAALICRVP